MSVRASINCHDVTLTRILTNGAKASRTPCNYVLTCIPTFQHSNTPTLQGLPNALKGKTPASLKKIRGVLPGHVNIVTMPTAPSERTGTVYTLPLDPSAKLLDWQKKKLETPVYSGSGSATKKKGGGKAGPDDEGEGGGEKVPLPASVDVADVAALIVAISASDDIRRRPPITNANGEVSEVERKLRDGAVASRESLMQKLLVARIKGTVGDESCARKSDATRFEQCMRAVSVLTAESPEPPSPVEAAKFALEWSAALLDGRGGGGSAAASPAAAVDISTVPPPVLVLLVGPQCIGKSTTTKALMAQGMVSCSADTHMKARGGFDYRLLSECHQACKRDAVEALLSGKSAVIDNTNMHSSFRAEYMRIAELCRVECIVHVISPELWLTCTAKVRSDTVDELTLRAERRAASSASEFEIPRDVIEKTVGSAVTDIQGRNLDAWCAYYAPLTAYEYGVTLYHGALVYRDKAIEASAEEAMKTGSATLPCAPSISREFGCARKKLPRHPCLFLAYSLTCVHRSE